MREIGIVKWFDYEKGFGFISRIDEVEDVFIHITQLACKSEEIREGNFVTYIISNGKKREAKGVKLLKDEQEVLVLKRAFQSKRNGVWQFGFKKYLPLENPTDKIIDEVIDKLDNYRNSSALIEYIPEHFFGYTDRLDKYLSHSKKVKLLISRTLELKDSSERLENISELIKLLQSEANIKSWELVPDNLLSNSIDLYEVAPKARIFTYLLKSLVKERNNKNENELFLFLKRNKSFVKEVPEDYLKNNNDLLSLLPTRRQVEIIWPELENRWNTLPMEAKILAVYKSAKENEKIECLISKLKNKQESNLLVRAYVFILSAKLYGGEYLKKGINTFNQAHSMIQEYFVSEIIKANCENYVFPVCNHNLTRFCEGRKWFNSTGEGFVKNNLELEVAYCPRKAGPCEISEFGAKIYSDISKEWSKWTLAELLECCSIVPDLPELNNNDVYILKLSGWINRLIEIRERMQCTTCNEIMIANFKYAKNLAVYNTTVAQCRHGHEQVYLTHCWACHKIIDSRESRYKVNVVYICIHCGSGPKKYGTTFSQGDICPNCNAPNMQEIDYREKACIKCNHRIKLPIDRYITGNGNPLKINY